MHSPECSNYKDTVNHKTNLTVLKKIIVWQGRSRMRWEDCVKRDLKEWEENGEQRLKIEGRGDW